MQLAIVLIVMLLYPSIAHADRLFTTGLEENNIVSNSVMWTSQNNVPALSTTTVRSGTYSLRILGNGGVEPYMIRWLAASVTSGTYFMRMYYRFPTLPAADLSIFSFANTAGSTSGRLTLLTTGGLRLQNAVTSTTDDSAVTLSTDTWYRVEIRYVVSDTVGELEVRVNGVSEASITGEDTLSTNFVQFTFGTSVTHAHDSFYDDLAINDANGSFQNSWPGDGKIVLVNPTADDAVAWTKAGSAPAATNFEGVDDIPGSSDDGTTYNEDSGTTNEDRLGHGGLPAEVGAGDTMVLIDVYARVSAGATSQTLRLLVWNEGGTQTTGPSVSLANGTWAMLSTLQHLVVSLAGKSKANVDAFDIGYEGLSGASAKRVSSIWASVEFAPAVGIASAPKGSQLLLDAGR